MKANITELQSSTESHTQSSCYTMQEANHKAESAPVSADGSTAVKAINSNTFVVKLKSCEKVQPQTALQHEAKPLDVNQELSPIPNLLQLVHGSNKNKIQIKSLKVHAKPAGNFITIIKPNGLGNSPIIKKFPKSAYQSIITLNNLRTKENEEKENQGSKNNNKNRIWSTSGNVSGNNSKFTFSLEPFSSVKKEIPDEYQRPMPIHVTIPELRPVSPLKSVDENLKPKLNGFLDDDGDLTNLSWLSNGKNPLKELPMSTTDEFGIVSDEDEKDFKNSPNSVFTASSKVEGSLSKYSARYEQNREFNPNGKPPYSFSCLIFMAIEDSLEKKLPVKAIYNWVCRHFPYFYTAPPGWKNSIRHNLSLNKCFKKADIEQWYFPVYWPGTSFCFKIVSQTHDPLVYWRENVYQSKGLYSGAKDPSKGSLWCIDPAYRPNLIQALKRTPFYPYIHPSGIGQPLSLSNLANLLPGAQSGRIPLWSPNLTTHKPYSDADPDAVNAALNLLGLKAKADENSTQNIRNTINELQKEILEKGCWPCPWNNSLNRSESCSSLDSYEDGIIVSRDSNDDHNYTKPLRYITETHDSETPLSPESDKSAPDAAYEFETGGTDEEEYFDEIVDREEEIVTTDSDVDDLTDSGFGMTKNKSRLRSPKLGRKRKRQDDCIKTKGDRTKKMKVKMGPKTRKKDGSKISPKKNKKVYSSDGDSGKDSPKVVRSRSYKRKVVPTPTELSNEYKKTYPNQLMRHRTKGNYSTRSTSISRYSTRLSGRKSEETSKRRTRRSVGHGSGALSNDEEEIKLAAGSLIHLAGFKSPATMVS